MESRPTVLEPAPSFGRAAAPSVCLRLRRANQTILSASFMGRVGIGAPPEYRPGFLAPELGTTRLPDEEASWEEDDDGWDFDLEW